MKLIISGVPRTGKTFFGDWLRDVHGFAHANLEERFTDHGSIVPPASSFELPAWLASLSENVVATWGFAPMPGWVDLLNAFVDAGFVPCWFHCDYAMAREQYATREGERKAADRFDPQIALLERASPSLDAYYGNNRIRTLTTDGYKPVEETHAAVIAMNSELQTSQATLSNGGSPAREVIAAAFERSAVETQRLIAAVADC